MYCHPLCHFGADVSRRKVHRYALSCCSMARAGGCCISMMCGLCMLRAQDVEKGCVREAPMAYVVAFSGNTAKDVTQRCAGARDLFGSFCCPEHFIGGCRCTWAPNQWNGVLWHCSLVLTVDSSLQVCEELQSCGEAAGRAVVAGDSAASAPAAGQLSAQGVFLSAT